MEPLLYLYMLHVFGLVISSSINCPSNETEWIARSKSILCQGSDVYHCLLVEDDKSRKEKCIEKTLILQGHCPIFTKNDYLHWKTCNSTGCPKIAFRSDEVYKYPICYGHINEKTNDRQNNAPGNQPLSDNSLMIGIIAVIVIITVALVAVVLLVLKYRRHQQLCFARSRSLESSESHALIPKDEVTLYGIEILKKRNILYIVGQLGNSVSTTGKRIAEIFAEGNMECTFGNYIDFSKDFSIKPNTVYFIDGWGGLWNENPCEKELSIKTIESIVQLSNSRQDVKFIIGICTDVQKKYEKALQKRDISMIEDETLHIDTITEYKAAILKESIKSLKMSCSNKKCSCKTLKKEDLSEILRVDVNVKIGRYLIVKLFEIDHALIPEFLSEGPLKAMIRHFEKLLEHEKDFPWIPYIVCMGYYDENNLEEEIANCFNISKETLSSCEDLEKYTKEINKKNLAPMWSSLVNRNNSEIKRNVSGNVRVFKHNFLYICAFHAFYGKYPAEMMRFCNVDAILQLVRRDDDPSEPFEIHADDEHVDIFCERIKNHINESTLSVHPLF